MEGAGPPEVARRPAGAGEARPYPAPAGAGWRADGIGATRGQAERSADWSPVNMPDWTRCWTRVLRRYSERYPLLFRQFVERHANRPTVHQLPPYAPDLNPVEALGTPPPQSRKPRPASPDDLARLARGHSRDPQTKPNTLAGFITETGLTPDLPTRRPDLSTSAAAPGGPSLNGYV
ncbi:hypothetical protein GCM10010289_81200 [Streptomyces violascens]|uniref:Tc1-like transposase DDE domain-containing protein n=1 Tax=Streptomyces violascens TaxID=67381 RepID=A0ABQ3QRK6_9ACTN|nr:hypothetical protein GCM10010289_81200 [Streptomyces violascens]GHI39904.1 hypothetical protein Sviol_43120 [Streptomyces violascens]